MSGGGSGGGGNQYYDNLNALYGQQTAQSKELMGMAQSTVFPAYKQLVQQAQDTGSQANQDKVGGEALAASNASTTTQQKALSDNLASMGVNPADQRYSQAEKDISLQGAASGAALSTGARQQQRNLGFARLQDATSMGMGTPTQATAAANAAGSSAASAGNMWQNQQQMNSGNVGGAIRGGIDLYGMFGHKDGGYIGPIHLKGGGYVQRPLRLAGGGFVGALQGIVPPMPPPSMPRQTMSPLSMASSGIKLAAPVAGTFQDSVGRGIQAVGQTAGSRDVTAFGNGVSVPSNADPALKQFMTSPDTIDYQMHATRAVDAALPGGAPGAEQAATGAADLSTGGAGAASAAGDAAASAGGEAAAGEAGSALGSALGAVGTAVPFIGAGVAAYGIGKSLGWWADGGPVHPGSVGQTGNVSGPGGPKDDLIPAMLSDGEFVMPVGAVKKFGLDKLNKMRADGLEFEKQLGIR